MRDTRRAAEYLFDEIGGIDDSFIAAAQSARPMRARKPLRVAALAAAAVLVMAMVVALPMNFITNGVDKDSNEFYGGPASTKPIDGLGSLPDDDGWEDKPSTEQSMLELDGILGGAPDSFYVGGVPELFDGTPRLLWLQDGRLYGVKLTASELKNLRQEQDRGDQIGDAAEAEIMVWISYGNGLVVSPYLEDSPGNVGYGELFDYSPEIIPSSAVTGQIRTIIARQT